MLKIKIKDKVYGFEAVEDIENKFPQNQKIKIDLSNCNYLSIKFMESFVASLHLKLDKENINEKNITFFHDKLDLSLLNFLFYRDEELIALIEENKEINQEIDKLEEEKSKIFAQKKFLKDKKEKELIQFVIDKFESIRIKYCNNPNIDNTVEEFIYNAVDFKMNIEEYYRGEKVHFKILSYYPHVSIFIYSDEEILDKNLEDAVKFIDIDEMEQILLEYVKSK